MRPQFNNRVAFHFFYTRDYFLTRNTRARLVNFDNVFIVDGVKYARSRYKGDFMCQLFAVCGKRPTVLNALLRVFYARAAVHKDGWSFTDLDGAGPVMIKKKESAAQCKRVQELLEQELSRANAMAHIRLCSRGTVCVENCHPFVRTDVSGRIWTFMHNGTFFDESKIERYKGAQKGSTDSERAALYIVEKIDAKIKELGRALDERERFELVEEATAELAPYNVFNYIAYDGDMFYVHANSNNYDTGLPVAIYTRKTAEGAVLWATGPLDDETWEPVPKMRVLAYRQGELVFTGAEHGHWCDRSPAVDPNETLTPLLVND